MSSTDFTWSILEYLDPNENTKESISKFLSHECNTPATCHILLKNETRTSKENENLMMVTVETPTHKMVKHTQTIRRQIADELLERVWPCSEIAA